MKKKLLGIFVCMLLIATSLPAVGTMTEKEISTNNPRETLQPPGWGLDQKQTSNCGSGMQFWPPLWHAQSFKPTKNKLTAVQIHCFKYHDPPAGIELTVSIRDSLNGSDLTEVTVNADQIVPTGTWVTFDFPDIDVTPENTYYIVCRSDGGDAANCYAWLYDLNNSYDRGEAWISPNNDSTWVTLWEYWGSPPQYPDPDLCFKTFTKKSKDKAFDINTLFLRFLENHPRMFPILRQLLRL